MWHIVPFEWKTNKKKLSADKLCVAGSHCVFERQGTKMITKKVFFWQHHSSSAPALLITLQIASYKVFSGDAILLSKCVSESLSG